MLPSMLSKLFWGDSRATEVEADGVEIKHTTREEAGDWLLISCQNSSADLTASGKSNGRVNSECDLDSECSDGSWVITPAPTFQRPSSSTHQDEASHPLEDLLIEHPTMSIYHQNSANEADSINRDTTDSEVIDETNEEQNQHRELVLLQNRQRQQIATQMQVPLAIEKRALPKGVSSNPPKLTRRALKRHNPMSRHGAKYQVQKCGFKAGRRRC